MRNTVPRILVPILLCSVFLGVGCGDDTKVEPRLDSGLADGKAMDTNQFDTTAKPDTQVDMAPTPDANKADLAGDADKADIPVPQDVPQGDAPAQDAGLGDASADLGDGSADAVGGSTQATITFRFKNDGAQAVYLRSECVFPIKIVSVAEGTEYANGYSCGCDCAAVDCQDPIQCAPCAPPDGVAVDPGKNQAIAWTARRSTMQIKTGPRGAFQCVAFAPIPTGTYRVSIQVYPTMVDAAAKTNGRTVSLAFPLTTTNATVEVTL